MCQNILANAKTISANNYDNNAEMNTTDRESAKAYFLQLVKGNKELYEIEKRYCREKFIYVFELQNAKDKESKQRECWKCQTTRYSDKYCEVCISLNLQNLFN